MVSACPPPDWAVISMKPAPTLELNNPLYVDPLFRAPMDIPPVNELVCPLTTIPFEKVDCAPAVKAPETANVAPWNVRVP